MTEQGNITGSDVYRQTYEDFLDPTYPGNFDSLNNPEIIYGAPGCGKTTYLLEKLSEMLEFYDSRDIAFVSFTNKGVDVGKYRARDQFGLSASDVPYFRTLHSMCFILGKFNRNDLLLNYYKFLKGIGFNMRTYVSNSFMTDSFTSSRNIYVELHNLRRNNSEKFRSIPEDKYDVAELEYFEEMYYQYKEKEDTYDFTDILYYALLNKLIPDIKVAIIDESQDLTTLQWLLCFSMFRNCEKVFVAGDDDQAIYEWGGSDVDIFLKVYGKRTVLDTTYRLPPTVFTLSQELVHTISNRQEKNFKPVADLSKKESNIDIVYDLLLINLKTSGNILFVSSYNIRSKGV